MSETELRIAALKASAISWANSQYSPSPENIIGRAEIFLAWLMDE